MDDEESAVVLVLGAAAKEKRKKAILATKSCHGALYTRTSGVVVLCTFGLCRVVGLWRSRGAQAQLPCKRPMTRILRRAHASSLSCTPTEVAPSPTLYHQASNAASRHCYPPNRLHYQPAAAGVNVAASSRRCPGAPSLPDCHQKCAPSPWSHEDIPPPPHNALQSWRESSPSPWTRATASIGEL